MATRIRATLPAGDTPATLAERLAAAGIDPAAIRVSVQAADREKSFIVRLVVAIALWSITGAAAGVALGALIWLLLGPEGTTGFIIQAVVWGIFGHLLAGLWAGYLLLADRTQEDLPHDRPAGTVTITIVCHDEEATELVRSLLEPAPIKSRSS